MVGVPNVLCDNLYTMYQYSRNPNERIACGITCAHCTADRKYSLEKVRKHRRHSGVIETKMLKVCSA